MRRALAAVGALATALALTACAAPPPEPLPPLPRAGALRVATWNVLGAQADTAVYDEHAGWAARVRQLAPDVLVLQEAQAADVAAFTAPDGAGYAVASYLQWECDLKGDREGVAVLVRPGLAVTGTGGTHVGDSCLDPTMRRVLVWADVEVDGVPVRIYGTHLTAGGGAAATSRDEQARRIRALVAADEAAGVQRWVLAGDLNAHPGGSAHRLLLGGEPGVPGPAAVVDTYAEVSPLSGDPAACPAVAADDEAGLAGLWADPELVRTCGHTAGWPKDDNWLGCQLLSLCESWQDRRDSSVRVRIDYVLRSAGLATGGSRVPNRTDPDWAAAGAEWFRLSDHLPVVSDLDPVSPADRATRGPTAGGSAP
jgi:endonuclease/exonuclease/phosphatase family metal-dependent hydrolase